MNETTIMLTPSPGVQPEFLATVEPVSTDASSQQLSLPFELVLDGYTREPWSSGMMTHNSEDTSGWKTCYLLSTDGRNRLPGFLKYLRDRKKACVAKFNDSTASTRAILVVPFDPPPVPSEQLPAGVDKTQLLYVKYLADDRVLSRGKKTCNRSKQTAPDRAAKTKREANTNAAAKDTARATTAAAKANGTAKKYVTINILQKGDRWGHSR